MSYEEDTIPSGAGNTEQADMSPGFFELAIVFLCRPSTSPF